MTPSLFALVTSFALVAQSPRGMAAVELDGIAVSIDYGRPSLKGREMVSSLPVGHVWRLGVDEATSFETSHELKFADVKIPAGSYSLFLKRTGRQDWALVFNSETGQWGTQHDVTRDFAEVGMEWSRRHAPAELLTIGLTAHDGGAELEIYWGTDVLSVRFRQP